MDDDRRAEKRRYRRPMTDLHAHILPGLDDGAENAEDSVEMAAIAADSGVAFIVATPHSYGNECSGFAFRDSVLSSLEYIQNEIDAQGIPIRLLPGMEIYGTHETAEQLERNDLLTINNTEYALIEFDFEERPREIYDILHPVMSLGITPVIAHPERYSCICESVSVAEELVAHGCLLQINKGSLLGAFGGEIMKTAMMLVKQGLAFCVASDAHSPVRRTTDMREARHTVEELFSVETAERLFVNNPLRILKGGPLGGKEAQKEK